MKISVERAANGYVVRDDSRDETFVLLDDTEVSFALIILDGVLHRSRKQLRESTPGDIGQTQESASPVPADTAVDEQRSRGWAPDEISSIYAMDIHRYVVSLIVSYNDSKRSDRTAGIENIHSPATAAAATLDMTRDSGSGSTVWRVFDRKTGTMHSFTQREFEKR